MFTNLVESLDSALRNAPFASQLPLTPILKDLMFTFGPPDSYIHEEHRNLSQQAHMHKNEMNEQMF